jgi:hypothetical protein
VAKRHYNLCHGIGCEPNIPFLSSSFLPSFIFVPPPPPLFPSIHYFLYPFLFFRSLFHFRPSYFPLYHFLYIPSFTLLSHVATVPTTSIPTTNGTQRLPLPR